MKIFAFNPSYSDEFDPYLVIAETEEEAVSKIRELFPHRILSEYKAVEVNSSAWSKTKMRDVYILESTGKTLR